MKKGDKLPNLKMRSHLGTWIHTLSLIGESNLLFINLELFPLSTIKLLVDNFDFLLTSNTEVYLFNQKTVEHNLELQRLEGLPFTIIADELKELTRVLKSKSSLFNSNPKGAFFFSSTGHLKESYTLLEFKVKDVLQLPH